MIGLPVALAGPALLTLIIICKKMENVGGKQRQVTQAGILSVGKAKHTHTAHTSASNYITPYNEVSMSKYHSIQWSQ